MLTILIILTILTWGLGQVFIKKGLAYFSPLQSLFIDTILALLIWAPFILNKNINIFNLHPLFYIAMILLGFNVALYYFVINKGPLAVIGPIVAVYPAITLILGKFFLGETLSFYAYTGIILVIFGIIFLSIPDKLTPVKKIWIVLALINSFGWGIEGVTNKIIIDQQGFGTFIVLLAMGQIFAITVWYAIDKPKRIFPKLPGKYLFPTIFGVFLWNAGTITYTLAMEKTVTSLVTPLTNLYVVVIVLFSVIFLKEKIRKIQVIAVGLIVLGLIILQLPPAHDNGKSVSLISHVIDGDTAELSGGKRIRLIGIDAPEYNPRAKQSDCFGLESREMLSKLILNQKVELEADIEETDKYGRTLRYIRSDNVFINEFMVRQGYAKVIYIEPNIKYYNLLKFAEIDAKENKRGLWGRCY